MGINHGEQSMKRLLAILSGLFISLNAFAVTPAQDVAATINLNGYACGSKASNIKETVDSNGNKTITASCADGKRYKINITNKGRVSVKPQ